MHRLAHDLGALRRHDYGIGGGSALYVGPALPSVPELGDTEETSLYQWISQLRAIGTLSASQMRIIAREDEREASGKYKDKLSWKKGGILRKAGHGSVNGSGVYS